MARFKTGFYIKVFVRSSNEINPDLWVRIFCGENVESMKQIGDSYRKRGYEVVELPYSKNELIKNKK